MSWQITAADDIDADGTGSATTGFVPGGGASLNKGFNFRDTLAFVTDGANQIFVNGTDVYPVTSGGVTFGWSSTAAEVDRSSSVDPRFAGVHYQSNTGTRNSFRVDLSAGTYTIHLAIGDQGASHTDQYVEVLDNTTSRAIIDIVGGVTADNFLDATGVSRTRANWPTQNVSISVNVSSGILIVKIGTLTDPGNSSVTVLAHMFID
jgi:hypothetical protein